MKLFQIADVQKFARLVGHLHINLDCIFSADVVKIWSVSTNSQSLIPHFSAKLISEFLRNTYGSQVQTLLSLGTDVTQPRIRELEILDTFLKSQTSFA